MQVKQVAIDKVVPYDQNPRKNGAAVDVVVASLREFGWRQPIVVDSEMTVIVGHTRLMAAKQLDLKKVPVHVADGLPPEQVRAYRIADNKTNEAAEWDEDLLGLELDELALANFDHRLTGCTPTGKLVKIAAQRPKSVRLMGSNKQKSAS